MAQGPGAVDWQPTSFCAPTRPSVAGAYRSRAAILENLSDNRGLLNKKLSNMSRLLTALPLHNSTRP